MIPKSAFFLWVGDKELPWLRQIAVETFKKHNPGWEVNLIRVPNKVDLLAAQSTDLFRYSLLARSGGLYLDTDIVFFRPVPDEILDCDVAITIDKSPFRYSNALRNQKPEVEFMPGFTNLAFLGASPDNKFFEFVYREALSRFEALFKDNVDISNMIYQVFGTELLNRLFYAKTQQDIEEQFGCKINNVPLNTVLPVRWYESHKLYDGTEFDPAPETIGVHWYGGCLDSQMYVSKITKETLDSRPCYLTSAIKRALS